MDSMLSTAARFIREGRIGPAKAIAAAVQALETGSVELTELRVEIQIAEGDSTGALALLDAELGHDPKNNRLRRLRARVHFLRDNIQLAASDASDAILNDPTDAKAKVILGQVLLKAGKVSDAAICLRDGLRSSFDEPVAIMSLAEAEEALAGPEAALAVLRKGIARLPGHVGLRNNAVLAAIKMSEFSLSYEIAETARREGVVDATLLGLRGHALSNLGRREEAGQSYQEALKLGPDDPYVRHLVASAGALPSAKRAPEDYIRVVFDGYAPRFDDHLIGLGYRGPGLIRAAVLRQLPTIAPTGVLNDVLDLGCGTGLVAVALSDLPVARLVGVDLSSRMLDVAKEKNIYTEIHIDDVCEFLLRPGGEFNLIVAADLLCYFGDIGPVFRHVARRLVRNGAFIFTVEALRPACAGTQWLLGAAGRYAHEESYVRSVILDAGLDPVEVRHEPLRLDGGTPVAGMVIVARHGASFQ